MAAVCTLLPAHMYVGGSKPNARRRYRTKEGQWAETAALLMRQRHSQLSATVQEYARARCEVGSICERRACCFIWCSLLHMGLGTGSDKQQVLPTTCDRENSSLIFNFVYPRRPCLLAHTCMLACRGSLSHTQDMTKAEGAMIIAAICARFDVSMAPGQV